MKTPRRVYRYACENYSGVLHTTLNPEGPGVVRIHLVPAKCEDGYVAPSVAIINGQDIIPVSPAWSILLSELIKAINVYGGKEVTDEDVENIIKATCKQVKKVFPAVGSRRLKKDIYTIMNTFKQVAYGETPDEEIGYMSMGEYAPFMKAPHRMDLMVSAMTKNGSWHCNQQCVHCYAAGQENSGEAELSTDEWKSIIDRCREAGIPQVTFTGGEPTMREDLVELIDYAQWFVTRLNTNGIKLTKEYVEKLKGASLDSCQITFYSCDSSVHNKLVGAQRFEDTVKGIENAVEAGLSVSINTPLCTLNKDYIKTLEFLHEKGVRYVTCSGLITTGNALFEKSESLQLSTEEIKDILKSAVEYCNKNAMEINFTSPGWIDEKFIAELGIPAASCGACLSNMAITPGGNVVPCQSWLSGEVLGSMLTDEWETIWEKKETKAHRAFSAEMTGTCPLRKYKGSEE